MQTGTNWDPVVPIFEAFAGLFEAYIQKRAASYAVPGFLLLGVSSIFVPRLRARCGQTLTPQAPELGQEDLGARTCQARLDSKKRTEQEILASELSIEIPIRSNLGNLSALSNKSPPSGIGRNLSDVW